MPRAHPRSTLLLALILLATTAGSASAQSSAQRNRRDRPEGAPAYALALGDAVRASAVDTGALYFNPAGMSLVRHYALQGGYHWQGDGPGHALDLAVVDSKTNRRLAMGLAYSHIFNEDALGKREGDRVRFGLASGYTAESWGLQLGVAGHYANLSQRFDDPPADGVERASPEFLTMDLGAILSVMNRLRIGVVGQNLIDTKAPREAPRRMGFGLGLHLDPVEITADVDLDLDAPGAPVASYHAGLEVMAGSSIVVRLGTDHDGLADHTRLAGGLGYVSEQIAIDAAYSKPVDEAGGSIVSVDLRYFVR